MTYQQNYEELINRFIKEKDLSIEKIQKEGKTSLKLAKSVYNEWKKYHDEVFWHSAIYEISFMDEVPTPPRIMNLLKISYIFAKELFDYYMDLVDEDLLKANYNNGNHMGKINPYIEYFTYKDGSLDYLKKFYTEGWDKFFNIEIAKDLFFEVVNGEGNESGKINVPHASSLQSLVIFNQVKDNPIKFANIKDEETGELIEFNEVHFELQNKVLNQPSSIDVVLKGGKNLLLIESKLIEIIRDSVDTTKDAGKYQTIKERSSGRNVVSVAYLKEQENSYVTSLNLKENELKDIGLDMSGNIKVDKGYVAINPVNDNSFVYSYGIKQLLCHIIGIKNIFDMSCDTEKKEKLLEGIKNIYFLTLYNEMPGFNSYDAVQKQKDFVNHYSEVIKILNKKNENEKDHGVLKVKDGISIHLCPIMSYQDLYKQNDIYFKNLKEIVEFYNLNK